ncbi:MAG: guanylate kinase [Gammaproteobacteria bacterium]|jgi:guanylate kinase
MSNQPGDVTTTSSLYVIAAPSGAGKTSLVKALLETTPDITVSVSHTTRQARPGEVHGEHYYFVDQQTFEQMRDAGEFLEYAQVFDNYYGTSRQSVEDTLKRGSDVILEIDWQGAQQIRRLYPDCCSIFILPPSREALEQRLRSRGQDNEKVIDRRMQDAIAEISHYPEFDYLVINDDFDQALAEMTAIVVARRQRTAIQGVRQQALLKQLLS